MPRGGPARQEDLQGDAEGAGKNVLAPFILSLRYRYAQDQQESLEGTLRRVLREEVAAYDARKAGK
jgi:hypothetical protein